VQVYLFNVDPSASVDLPLTPRPLGRYDGTFDETGASMLVGIARPEQPGYAGHSATCANMGGLFDWNVIGRLRVVRPGAPGDVVAIEVTDAEVLDPPSGHTIVIDYVRWEFVLPPPAVSP
jgi:hypothetical protein